MIGQTVNEMIGEPVKSSCLQCFAELISEMNVQTKLTKILDK